MEVSMAFKTGFGRVDITPFLGVGLSGYFTYRFCTGYLDPLYATALAIEGEGKDGKDVKALIYSVDCAGMPLSFIEPIITKISNVCDVPFDSIIITCTHTHTGPSFVGGDSDDGYNDFLVRRLCDVGRMAISDLTDSEISVGAPGKAEGLSFVRRYLMKDGSVRTNPGINNPNVAKPLGTPDTEVQAVYVKREGRDDIVLVQFQTHPDVIGGCKASSDWPGFVRKFVEEGKSGVKCMFFNGAQGDTNHIDTFPTESSPFIKYKGYELSRYMGRTVADAALASIGDLKPSDKCSVGTFRENVPCKIREFSPEELAESKKLLESVDGPEYRGATMEDLGRFSLARKIVKYSQYKVFDLPMFGVSFGNVVFVSVPGEPFTEIGRQIKKHAKEETRAFGACFVCCCSNGYQSYFPTLDAFSGGYEAVGCVFAPGVAENLIEGGKKIVDALK